MSTDSQQIDITPYKVRRENAITSNQLKVTDTTPNPDLATSILEKLSEIKDNLYPSHLNIPPHRATPSLTSSQNNLQNNSEILEKGTERQLSGLDTLLRKDTYGSSVHSKSREGSPHTQSLASPFYVPSPINSRIHNFADNSPDLKTNREILHSFPENPSSIVITDHNSRTNSPVYFSQQISPSGSNIFPKFVPITQSGSNFNQEEYKRNRSLSPPSSFKPSGHDMKRASSEVFPNEFSSSIVNSGTPMSQQTYSGMSGRSQEVVIDSVYSNFAQSQNQNDNNLRISTNSIPSNGSNSYQANQINHLKVPNKLGGQNEGKLDEIQLTLPKDKFPQSEAPTFRNVNDDKVFSLSYAHTRNSPISVSSPLINSTHLQSSQIPFSTEAENKSPITSQDKIANLNSYQEYSNEANTLPNTFQSNNQTQSQVIWHNNKLPIQLQRESELSISSTFHPQEQLLKVASSLNEEISNGIRSVATAAPKDQAKTVETRISPTHNNQEPIQHQSNYNSSIIQGSSPIYNNPNQLSSQPVQSMNNVPQNNRAQEFVKVQNQFSNSEKPQNTSQEIKMTYPQPSKDENKVEPNYQDQNHLSQINYGFPMHNNQSQQLSDNNQNVLQSQNQTSHSRPNLPINFQNINLHLLEKLLSLENKKEIQSDEDLKALLQSLQNHPDIAPKIARPKHLQESSEEVVSNMLIENKQALASPHSEVRFKSETDEDIESYRKSRDTQASHAQQYSHSYEGERSSAPPKKRDVDQKYQSPNLLSKIEEKSHENLPTSPDKSGESEFINENQRIIEKQYGTLNSSHPFQDFQSEQVKKNPDRINNANNYPKPEQHLEISQKELKRDDEANYQLKQEAQSNVQNINSLPIQEFLNGNSQNIKEKREIVESINNHKDQSTKLVFEKGKPMTDKRFSFGLINPELAEIQEELQRIREKHNINDDNAENILTFQENIITDESENNQTKLGMENFQENQKRFQDQEKPKKSISNNPNLDQEDQIEKQIVQENKTSISNQTPNKGSHHSQENDDTGEMNKGYDYPDNSKGQSNHQEKTSQNLNIQITDYSKDNIENNRPPTSMTPPQKKRQASESTNNTAFITLENERQSRRTKTQPNSLPNTDSNLNSFRRDNSSGQLVTLYTFSIY